MARFIWRYVLYDDLIEENERLPRIFHPRVNYHLHESVFRQSFRIDIDVFEQLERIIAPFLINTDKNNALSPREQILTALHFLGNDAQYHVNGLAHGISKSTVLRCIHRVCHIITNHLMPLIVRWPAASQLVEREFFNIAGFPHVKGVIDGTLVHIDSPSEDEPAYVGRDNKHSFNVLVVAGPRYQFFFASAKFPGSMHDARAVRKSQIWKRWQIDNWRPDNDEDTIILGDSAYPLTSWLITPTVLNANAHIYHLAQAVPIYERIHRRTRFIVENAIGILKEEYPCLNYLRVRSPIRISNIIYSCITLHNMQNIYRRGVYAYDDQLNRLAIRGIDNQQVDGVLDQQENINDHLNDAEFNRVVIARQRRLLEYFSS